MAGLISGCCNLKMSTFICQPPPPTLAHSAVRHTHMHRNTLTDIWLITALVKLHGLTECMFGWECVCSLFSLFMCKLDFTSQTSRKTLWMPFIRITSSISDYPYLLEHVCIIVCIEKRKKISCTSLCHIIAHKTVLFDGTSLKSQL